MRIAILTSLLFWCVAVSAQTVPQYTNFYYNRMVMNPAVSGYNNTIDFTLLYRGQWIGIEGAPSTQFFTAHGPINRISSAVGLSVVNDMMGAQRSTSFMLSYAYRLKRKWGDLAFGATIGAYQKAIDGTKLRSPEGVYTGGIDHQDGLIPDANVSGIAPEMQLGIFYTGYNIYAGFSVNNLLGSKIRFNAPSGNSEIRFARAYIFTAGYNIELSRTFNLLPNLQFKTDINNFQTDINVILSYKDNIHGGLGFRGNNKNNIDAFSLMLGFRFFKRLRIGYSYDVSISTLNVANSGSHEVFLKYELAIKDRSKPGKVIYNPRFL